MKKLLLLAALFLGTMTASAEAASDFLRGELEVSKDKTEATLHVYLNNTTSFVAFQMDFTFANVELTNDNVTSVTFAEGRDCDATFVTAYNVVSSSATSSTLRVVAYNLSNQAITGTAGDEVLTIKVKSSTALENVSDWAATLDDKTGIFVTSEELEEMTLKLMTDSTGETEVTDQTITGKSTTLIGDVTKDGLYTISDILAVIELINEDMTNAASYDLNAADTNSDGVYTITDLLTIIDLVNSAN